MNKMNNLKNYQITKVGTRLEIVETCLVTLKKSKNNSKNLTILANTLSNMVYQIELERFINGKENQKKQPKKMDYTTLYRKDGPYRVLLLGHLANLESGHNLSQIEAGMTSVKEMAVLSHKNSVNMTSAKKIEALENELSRLSLVDKENKRLQGFVTNFYGSATQTLGLSGESAKNDDAALENAILKSQTGDLVKALIKIVEGCEFLDIDFTKQTIIDVTKMAHNSNLVEPELLKVFFEHLKMLESHNSEMY
jgi:hypothetical protein